MSAYLLDHKEIAMIANAAYMMTCKPRALTEVWGHNGNKDFAMALADENIKSVEYRYPDMGPCAGMATADYIYKCEVAKEVPYTVNRDGAKGMYNLLAKYEYNACEHPEWHDDDANPVKMVINVMLKEAARKMAAHIEEEEETVADLVKRVEELRGVINALEEDRAERDAKIANLEETLEKADAKIEGLKVCLEKRNGKVFEMGAKLDKVKAALEENLELFA